MYYIEVYKQVKVYKLTLYLFLFFKSVAHSIQYIVQTIVVFATENILEEEILTNTSNYNVEARTYSSVLIVPIDLQRKQF